MTGAAPRALVIRVRFIEGRYHGEPEWPPSPARLFQALVAAAATPELDVDAAVALRWLEALPPPTLAAPIATAGRTQKTYVPNNDLDAKGGDPASVGSIRTGKITRPKIFDASIPVIYVWALEELVSEDWAIAVCEMARALYQLGRGVDGAHASGTIETAAELDLSLNDYPGQILRPNIGASGRDTRKLDCPRVGSLARLEERHQASLHRFGSQGSGRQRVMTFRQPPKPLFSTVLYESPPSRALFELRPSEDMGRFAFTPATRIVSLTERLRDAAAERLRSAMPTCASDIERALVGRHVEGIPRLDVDARVRLLPLPSIGSEHADRGVRRLLVEVPPTGPLRADDVFWAFSNLVCSNGQGSELRVTRASDQRMADHYGVGTREGHHVWRTVTAAALPLRGGRPARTGTERIEAEERVRNSVRRALRHAGIRSPIQDIRVQREPFERKGSLSGAFAVGTRFAEAQLWHVELAFRDEVVGPLVIGNGRFLGLGVLAPVLADRRSGLVLAFDVVSGLLDAPAHAVATALRRAVMARFQAAVDGRALPSFVSGHEPDGSPTERPHLSFVFDPDGSRLLVIAPSWSEREHLNSLGSALDGFDELRAGTAGRLRLRRAALHESEDPLLAPSSTWVSSTPYVVNRHRKAESAAEALRADLEAACRDRGMPTPRVTVLEVRGAPGIGLTGTAELRFDVAVRGPMILGRTRHKGGGLFRHSES